MATPFKMDHRVIRQITRLSQLQPRAAGWSKRIRKQLLRREPFVLAAAKADRSVCHSRT
jgi:hypothetical protein